MSESFTIYLMVSRHSMFYSPFTALLCRWDWIGSDIASRFKAAYRASRTWVNTTNPEIVAKSDYFIDFEIQTIS